MLTARRAPAPGRVRPTLSAAGLGGLVILADRITKHVVRGSIPLDASRRVLPGVVELVHYRNTGVAFDFLSGTGVLVLIVTGIALLALLAYFALHPGRRGAWVATGLLLGGALGNLLDRLIDGSVTDFIKFPDWPAFNVADIAITCGVIALVWVIEFGGGRTHGPGRG